MGSVRQALWKFVHGIDREMNVPIDCVAETTNLSDIMGPKFLSLSLSNFYSYKDFIETIRMGILVNSGTTEAARFEPIFEYHGLL